MKNHPRREFLIGLLAACGAQLTGEVVSAQGATADAPPGRDRATRTAVAYFGAAGAASKVGRAFLQHLQLAETPESIRAVAEATLQIIARAGTAQTARTALRRAVRRDFREGRYVQLHGWTLSRTELELCALVLLHAP